MRKKTLLFTLFSCLILLFPVVTFAWDGPANVVNDKSGLFTEKEIQELKDEMAPLSEKGKATIMIVTGEVLSTDDPRYEVDRTLGDYIGNDNNGILFYIDDVNRKVYISTSGNMIDYFTDSRISNAIEDITSNALKSDEYFDGAEIFLQHVDKNIKKGVPGGHYRVDEATGKITYYRVITPFEGFLAFLLAAVPTLLFFFMKKRSYQLKASSYRYDLDSEAQMQLTDRKDTLVNSFVTTRRIPKPSSDSSGGGGGGSTTHSSGGGTFGGGSGSF